MRNKISMLFLAVMLVGLLAGCGLRRDESGKAKEILPSSLSTASTGIQPNVEQSLPKATEKTTTSSSNSAESKKQLQDTLKLLEELEKVWSSLDTVSEQDLLKP